MKECQLVSFCEQILARRQEETSQLALKARSKSHKPTIFPPHRSPMNRNYPIRVSSPTSGSPPNPPSLSAHSTHTHHPPPQSPPQSQPPLPHPESTSAQITTAQNTHLRPQATTTPLPRQPAHKDRFLPPSLPPYRTSEASIK